VKIEAPRGTFDVLPAEQPVRDAIVREVSMTTEIVATAEPVTA